MFEPPMRSSSLPLSRGRVRSRADSVQKPSLPVRRVYTLKEYLASCRQSAMRSSSSGELSEDDEDEAASSSEAGGSFSSIPESDDEDDADSAMEDAPDDSLPPYSPSDPIASTSTSTPTSAPPVPPKPDPLESYITRVCSRWEEKNGWMYSLFPKHPSYGGRDWVVRYGSQGYVRAWYSVRIPGPSDTFDPLFWSWFNTQSLTFSELEALGMEFLSSAAGSEGEQGRERELDFPRWDLTTPVEDEDWENLLHYGSWETPAVRVVPPPPSTSSYPSTFADDEREREGRTVAEALEQEERRDKSLLWPGLVRDVKDAGLRVGWTRRERGRWERLREREKEVGRMVDHILRM